MSPTQKQALELYRNVPDEPRTAYRTASLSTMRALERQGYLCDTTPPGPGGSFSPATQYMWSLTAKGREYLVETGKPPYGRGGGRARVSSGLRRLSRLAPALRLSHWQIAQCEASADIMN